MFNHKDALTLYHSNAYHALEYTHYMVSNGFTREQSDTLMDCAEQDHIFEFCAKTDYKPETIKKLINIMKYLIAPKREKDQRIALAILEN